jgi:DNA-binding winged helix-turn-helix (wHTH) protein
VIDSNSNAATVIQFGSYEANLRTQELRKHGIPQRLPGQCFHILRILLERKGELVTRDELRTSLWPSDTFVDFDHGLNNAISRLRETLGDSAESPHLIETLPRRGYRFIAPLGDQSDCSLATPASSRPDVNRALFFGIVVALLVPTAAGWCLRYWSRHQNEER